MKTILLTVLSLGLILEVSAQNKETRKLADFDRLSVGESIDLVIEAGNENKALVEVRGAEIEDVLTEVNAGKLSIQIKRGIYRSTDIRVYVTYKKLNSIKVSSSASLKARSVLKSKDLRIKVSSSGRANLDVEADELQVAVSSSGRLTLNGNVKKQTVDVSSSGRYAAFDLKSEFLEADVSSSGRAEVYVTKEINANASSSGRITYKGNPDKVIADNSSSGRVTRAE